jgi:hypothetical protein
MGAHTVAVKFWTAIVALIMASPLGLVGAPLMAAQDAVADCTAFASFEEANAHYENHPEAVDAIDDDQDGTACEVYFGRERRESGKAKRESNTRPRQEVAELAQDAEGDLDCEDFETQDAAQATLDADPSDPNNLDPNGDQVACALLPAAADFEAAQEAEGETEQPAEEPADDAEARRAERRERRNQEQEEEGAPPPTCADFATQADAQVAFDADPEGMAGLDEDGNGIACEELIPEETAAEPVEESVDDAEARREERRARREAEEGPAEEGPVEEGPVEEVIDEPAPPPLPEDIDCIDFEFQEEAQVVYDEDPADPFNLDPNGDGFACSSLPLQTPVVTQVPRTGTGAESDSLAVRTAVAAATMLLMLATGAALSRRAFLLESGPAIRTWRR